MKQRLLGSNKLSPFSIDFLMNLIILFEFLLVEVILDLKIDSTEKSIKWRKINKLVRVYKNIKQKNH